MPCTIIQNPQSFKLSSKWEEVTSLQKGSIVDSNGKPINAVYAGSRYTVICEAQHTKLVHLTRLVKGVIAIIFTLGIAYFYSEKVKSLLTKKHKIYICHSSAILNDSNPETFNNDKLQNTSLINKVSIQKLGTPHNSVEDLTMSSPISFAVTKSLFIDQQSQTKSVAKISRYEWNAEHDVIKFFPFEQNWSKRLHPLEYFCCTVYTRGVLHFKETIDLNRFIEALQTTLKNFDFLFCRLHKDGEHINVSYSDNNDDFVQLEIGEDSSTSILPEKVDSRILTGITDDLEGLPMCALKLQKLKDGFSLGYHFNHALLDQSSVFYFFKYLANCYSNRNQAETLKKPEIINLDSLLPRKPPSFRDLNEFRIFGESEGFQYLVDKSELIKKVTTPFPGTVLNIHFKLSAISKLKAESATFVTENDLINALLLKVYMMDPKFLPEEEQHFSFACNMRKRCGLDENIMGNVVYSCKMDLKTEFIRNSSLLELAQFNRKALNELTPEAFKRYVTWYGSFPQFSQIPKDYIPTNFIKSHHWVSTNWSSFQYQEILFDSQNAVKLTTPSAAALVAALGMSVICFDKSGDNKTLNTTVGVPTTCLSTVREYGISSGLFETSKIDETTCLPARGIE